MSDKKLTILIDAYKDPYAGTEGQVYKLVSELTQRDWQVQLVTLRPSNYLNSNDFPCPTNCLHINSITSPLSAFKILTFARRLKKDGFHLVHIFFNDASILAPFFLKLFGIKVIISRRDMGFWHNSFNLLALRANQLFIDKYIVNSKAVKKITADKEHAKQKKIEVIYNGYIQPNSDTTASKRPDDMPDGNIVGIAANIRPIKCIDHLIKAFKIVSIDHPSANLVIVGDGDKNELLGLASNLAIQDKVFFLGAKSNAIDYIKYFDIGVICSESEGLSNAIVEYMQMAKPVVCTDVGGNPEIVIHKATGFVVGFGKINHLAEKISHLLANQDWTTELGQKGLARVKKEFSIEKMISAHESLYVKLIN